MSDASSSPCKRGAEMPGMEGVEGHGSPFWGVKGVIRLHTATAKGSKVCDDPGMYTRHSDLSQFAPSKCQPSHEESRNWLCSAHDGGGQQFS